MGNQFKLVPHRTTMLGFVLSSEIVPTRTMHAVVKIRIIADRIRTIHMASCAWYQLKLEAGVPFDIDVNWLEQKRVLIMSLLRADKNDPTVVYEDTRIIKVLPWL